MTVRRMNWYPDEGYVGDEFIDCHMGEVFWASSYSVALCVRLNYVDPTQWSSLFSLALPAGGEPRLSVEIKPDRVVDFLLNGVECLCPSLPVPEDEWVIIAVTDNGAVAPRLHLYRFETDTWAHASFDTKPPWASPALLENGRVRFGHFDHNDWATVDFDRAAFYHYAHSDTNIEKLSKTPDWDSDPTAVIVPVPITYWVLGDAPVVDRMGHGADEVESNGTQLLYEFGPYTEPGPVRVKTSHGWLDLGGGEPGPSGVNTECLYRAGGYGPARTVPAASWRTLDPRPVDGVTYPPSIVPDGAFTENADGSVTVRDGGWYLINAGAQTSVPVNTTLYVTVGTTLDAEGYTVARQNTVGSASVAPAAGTTGVAYLAAGTKLYVNVFSTIAIVAASLYCTGLQISKIGAGPQGPPGEAGAKGDPGGSNTLFEDWHEVGAAGEPAFTAPWTNYGGGYETVGFRKTPDGRVVLKGLATHPSAASRTIFTLPPGYRPSANKIFTSEGASAPAANYSRFDISTTGEVLSSVSQAAGAIWVAMDGIEFYVEPAVWPSGSQGPKGDPGPQGTFLGVQENWGTENAYSANIAAMHNVQKTNGVLMDINFTPPVDAWWELFGFLGYFQKMDAAYHYAALNLVCTPKPENWPTINNAINLGTQHSTVNVYTARDVRRTAQLKAGIAYQAYLQVGNISGGSWRYYRGAEQLYIEGKAWAR